MDNVTNLEGPPFGVADSPDISVDRRSDFIQTFAILISVFFALGVSTV